MTIHYSVNCDGLCYSSTFLCSVDLDTMDLSVSPATCSVYYTRGELFKLRSVHKRDSLDLFNELSAHRCVCAGKHKQRLIPIISSPSNHAITEDHCELLWRWGINPSNLISIKTTTMNNQPRRCAMKLRCVNTRSVRNKTVAVNDLFSDHELDVLALTDTWQERSSYVCLSAIIPPGSSIVEQARPVPAKAATIACLTRGWIKLTKIDIPQKPVSFKVLCSRLRNQNSSATSVLSVIYQPGSKHLNSKFLSEISEHIESLASYSCPVYLIGDFNIHVQN